MVTDQLPGPEHAAPLRVHSEYHGTALVVSLVGELDMSTADHAATALRTATAGAAAVVVDLTGLTFFASAGLNILLQLRKELRDAGVDVRLAANQRAVLRPLELMGVADQFPIDASTALALGALRS